ncbi:PDR/VanB family oxidoreductase [Acinetobacter stercoris]|uniref:Phthalate dioxygenase reductase n=1 Tax=Acinetobacter stercoris TaxID=2126983 RepID=A0A2U3N3B0_9GAMM|nr:PDR/VanB family oxidoreductase [Acinetobacter stercoris]SPL72180.1 Phthalate dioxygenase reductase [Acinetobacter stercoris]
MYVQIKSIKDLTPNIRSFELITEDGRDLPSFTAGSHIDIVLGNGLIRQYSIANCCSEKNHYIIGVLEDDHSRGGSSFIHQQFKVGDRIEISEPRNLFPVHQNTNKALLFAGGIGITPILSMAHTLKRENIPFEFYYFVRNENAIAFKDILESKFSEEIHFHIEDDPQNQLDVNKILSKFESSKHLYVCGPNGFMDFIFTMAEKHHWQKDHLHKEHFTADSAASDEENTEFSVKIASTGELIPIAVNQSITEALEKCGIEIAVSCEQGICGTCLTNILEGEPEHRDMFLTDEEHASNKIFTPCCSRSKTKILVLDL